MTKLDIQFYYKKNPINLFDKETQFKVFEKKNLYAVSFKLIGIEITFGIKNKIWARGWV